MEWPIKGHSFSSTRLQRPAENSLGRRHNAVGILDDVLFLALCATQGKVGWRSQNSGDVFEKIVGPQISDINNDGNRVTLCKLHGLAGDFDDGISTDDDVGRGFGIGTF